MKGNTSLRQQTKPRIFVNIGIGFIAGLLAALITSLITSILQLPSKIALPIVLVVAIAFAVLLSWLTKKHPLKTLRISAIVLISLGVLTIFSSYFPSLWANIIWVPTVVGLAVGIIGVGIAYLASSVSLESDERMVAMANLEFYEKIAVVESYIQHVAESYIPTTEDSKKAFANRIYYDIKGAKQLNEYVDHEIKDKLKEEIKGLKKIATEHKEEYKELIDKLNKLQEEDLK